MPHLRNRRHPYRADAMKMLLLEWAIYSLIILSRWTRYEVDVHIDVDPDTQDDGAHTNGATGGVNGPV